MQESRTPTIGVGVMIVRKSDKKFLIGKRGENCKRGKGCMAMPGGRVSLSENIAAAILREVYEETGLFVRPVPVFGAVPFLTTVPFAITDHDPRDDHITLWCMAEMLFESEPVVKEPDKCDFWKWVNMKDVSGITGVEDRSTEQYCWLPLDMFRATLPMIIFEE